MAEEPSRGFPKKVQKALRDGDYQYALRMFQDAKYEQEVADKAWDLIPVIAEHLSQTVSEERPEFFKGCLQLVDIITVKSTVDDVVIQLVTHIEQADSDVKFVALMNTLPAALQRIRENTGVNKSVALSWIFNAFLVYLLKHYEGPMLDVYNLTGKERLLLDHHKIVPKLVSVYTSVLIFIDTCLESLDLDDEVKSVVCRFLIDLLGNPLCLYHIDCVDGHPNQLLILASEITEKVFTLLDDPMKQVDKQSDFDSRTTANPCSVGSLFYLVYVQGVCYQLVPKVYEHKYLLEKCTILFNALFEITGEFAIEKALHLCSHFLTLTKGKSVSYLILDDLEQCKFFKLLSNIIIYDRSEVNRKTALKVLGEYLVLLDTRGYYQLILNLFNLVNHSGFRGYLITSCKDQINRSLKSKDLSCYFKASKLFTLLKNFCQLDKGEQTDLMENSDQIISALNFIRFMALVESSSNHTNFWDFKLMLLEQFLNPLGRALELSRAHYNLEIRTTKEGAINKPGQSLMGDKLPVLEASITAFDVMESLLSRVTELLYNVT